MFKMEGLVLKSPWNGISLLLIVKICAFVIEKKTFESRFGQGTLVQEHSAVFSKEKLFS